MPDHRPASQCLRSPRSSEPKITGNKELARAGEGAGDTGRCSVRDVVKRGSEAVRRVEEEVNSFGRSGQAWGFLYHVRQQPFHDYFFEVTYDVGTVRVRSIDHFDRLSIRGDTVCHHLLPHKWSGGERRASVTARSGTGSNTIAVNL